MRFKSYLTLLLEGFGKLSVAELAKRPARVVLFKQKIKDKRPFKLNDGTDVVLKKDKTYKLLDTNLSDFGGRNPKILFTTIDGVKLRLSAFAKSSEFGGGGGSKVSEDKTTLQEVGLLVMLDSLIENGGSLVNYTPSNRLHIAANVQNVIDFLQTDKTWFKASLNGAKTMLKEFSDIASYQFHHDDNKFSKIRKLGKRLSGASSPDKWNPSDVYFIKNSDFAFDDIFNYNDFLSDEANSIGVSLKKGEKEAMHGAFALTNVSKAFNINYKKNTFSSIEESRSYLLKKFKSLQTSNVGFYAKFNPEETKLSEIIENLEPTTDTYLTSIVPQLNFFDSFKSKEEMDKVLKFAILTAMSMSPFSCPHFKLEGSKLSSVPSNDKKIIINRVILPLNGDQNSLIDFSFNGKQMLVSIRSKGSQPQFNILKSSFSSDVKTLASF